MDSPSFFSTILHLFSYSASKFIWLSQGGLLCWRVCHVSKGQSWKLLVLLRGEDLTDFAAGKWQDRGNKVAFSSLVLALDTGWYKLLAWGDHFRQLDVLPALQRQITLFLPRYVTAILELGSGDSESEAQGCSQQLNFMCAKGCLSLCICGVVSQHWSRWQQHSTALCLEDPWTVISVVMHSFTMWNLTL